MATAFASKGDLEEKEITFEELAEGVYAFTAEGDPNSGVIVGDDSVMVLEAQATPKLARKVMEFIRGVTDKPIKHLALSHYHAVRVLGASEYGAEVTYMSKPSYELVVERGQQDWDSEFERFPRLFDGHEEIPSLTWPTVVFEDKLDVYLGKRKVELIQIGRGHTKGDTVVWIPDCKVCFAGDLVEYGATPYTGDAYLREWPKTLDKLAALGAEKMIPGRGAALKSKAECEEAVSMTRSFLTDMYGSVEQCVKEGMGLKEAYDVTFKALEPKYGDWVIFQHCLPFDVSRAFDEASGIDDPRIWTDKRDAELWETLA